MSDPTKAELQAENERLRAELAERPPRLRKFCDYCGSQEHATPYGRGVDTPCEADKVIRTLLHERACASDVARQLEEACTELNHYRWAAREGLTKR